MKPECIRSVQNSDQDVLSAIKTLFLGGRNFVLDPCYSQGEFYGGLERPYVKMDKVPLSDEVIENDLLNGLPIGDDAVESIVFDPPFMFKPHGKEFHMKERFTIFNTWEDLEEMYKKSLAEFYRVLKRGGILAFKCQDYTDNKTTLTHCYVWRWAKEIGFKEKDLFIKVFEGVKRWNSKLTQRHARKHHCYWFVFQK